MYTVLFSFVAIVVAYLCFVCLFRFPESVYAEDSIHNLISAQKNGFTLLGCSIGLILVYTADLRWIKFDTSAVWWVQIIKAVGGILIVVAAKELLRAPLDTLFDGHFAARSIRYFLIVVIGGILWPMTFKYLSKFGKKKQLK